MIPNYKRPSYREYIYDRLCEPLTDEDFDMIEYVEGLEKEDIRKSNTMSSMAELLLNAKEDALKSILSPLKDKGCKFTQQEKESIWWECSNCGDGFYWGDDMIVKYCPTCGCKVIEIVRLDDEEVI